MKYRIVGLLFLLQSVLYAQNDCTYAQNVTDSLGTYKSTRDYIVHERNFGNSASYLFFSLIQDNGMPVLGVQFIQKSADFIKAACFDKTSRVYLQLENGKVVSLLYAGNETCGTMVPLPEEGKRTRVLSGNFVFMKGNYEDLETSPVSLVRIKYTTETVDYAIRKVLVSELTKEAYGPASYFIDYLKCVK